MNYYRLHTNNQKTTNNQIVDITLIGAGIMSATLATFLKILEPKWTIHIYERLQDAAQESSNVWNNAGTGHAAFCELNYTTENKNGMIDISKAIKINELFEISLQFWSYLTKNNILNKPEKFINNIPHMSFVWGDKNIKFLKKRFQAMQKYTPFHSIQYSDNPQKIKQWIPLVMEGRHPLQKIAVTRTENGTDINFGEITQQLLNNLKNNKNFYIYFKHHVQKINKKDEKTWAIYINDLKNKQKKIIITKYVFIGAGGGSLTLLQSSGIKEVKEYAGFPVGGKFLMTQNEKITQQHYAKVYGQSPVNAPPMSVPHIDTRIINGNKILLFGPFATFNSKFLKYGTWCDIFNSLTYYNILPIFKVGVNNIKLIQYLIQQTMMSQKKQFHALQEYYPTAKLKDWSLLQAGQRVQIIKKNDNNQGSTLQFGTEIINDSTGTLTALLGASPGASTSAAIILEILKIMFKKQIQQPNWIKKLKEIIPKYDHKVNDELIVSQNIEKQTRDILKLNNNI